MLSCIQQAWDCSSYDSGFLLGAWASKKAIGQVCRGSGIHSGYTSRCGANCPWSPHLIKCWFAGAFSRPCSVPWLRSLFGVGQRLSAYFRSGIARCVSVVPIRRRAPFCFVWFGLRGARHLRHGSWTEPAESNPGLSDLRQQLMTPESDPFEPGSNLGRSNRENRKSTICSSRVQTQVAQTGIFDYAQVAK